MPRSVVTDTSTIENQALSTTQARCLTVMALAYGLLHHVGTISSLFGTVGSTSWTDWVDLLTPYAILLPAGATLLSAGAGLRVWSVYLVGAIMYADGHGIHLAANSIGRTKPGPEAHLWDEVVGHYVWYAGWTLVLAALTVVLAQRAIPRGAFPYVLALLVGTTVATNALEGGTVPLTLITGAAFVVVGWRTRRGLGRLLMVAYGPAPMILGVYGVRFGGFPQPSQLT